MVTCKDCIHYEACVLNSEYVPSPCRCFKNKANVVEVVRCKDCGMFVDNKEALVTYCKRECKNLTVNPSDFCGYGERKTDDAL